MESNTVGIVYENDWFTVLCLPALVKGFSFLSISVKHQLINDKDLTSGDIQDDKHLKQELFSQEIYQGQIYIASLFFVHRIKNLFTDPTAWNTKKLHL